MRRRPSTGSGLRTRRAARAGQSSVSTGKRWTTGRGSGRTPSGEAATATTRSTGITRRSSSYRRSTGRRQGEVQDLQEGKEALLPPCHRLGRHGGNTGQGEGEGGGQG